MATQNCRPGACQLGPERAAALNAVETSLKLPADQVEMLIAAGRDALKTNTAFRQFLGSLGQKSPLGQKPPRTGPVAAPVVAPHEADAEGQ